MVKLWRQWQRFFGFAWLVIVNCSHHVCVYMYTSGACCVCSAIMYLNEDFTGGDFFFADTAMEEQVSRGLLANNANPECERCAMLNCRFGQQSSQNLIYCNTGIIMTSSTTINFPLWSLSNFTSCGAYIYIVMKFIYAKVISTTCGWNSPKDFYKRQYVVNKSFIVHTI